MKRLNKNMDEEGGGRKFKFYTFSERISEAGENLISATRGISKLDEFTELKEVFRVKSMPPSHSY